MGEDLLMIAGGLLILAAFFAMVIFIPAIFRPEDVDPVVKFLKRRAASRRGRDMRERGGPDDRNHKGA